MPVINNLEHQFNNLSTSESLTKDVEASSAPTLISPAKSEASASVFSASDDEASQEGDSSNVLMLAKKTAHKLMEEQGMMADEPLLKENPYRFVLFPIQDNDVRINLIAENLLPSCECPRKSILPSTPSSHLVPRSYLSI
jgi:hypothetical protein